MNVEELAMHVRDRTVKNVRRVIVFHVVEPSLRSAVLDANVDSAIIALALDRHGALLSMNFIVQQNGNINITIVGTTNGVDVVSIASMDGVLPVTADIADANGVGSRLLDRIADTLAVNEYECCLGMTEFILKDGRIEEWAQHIRPESPGEPRNGVLLEITTTPRFLFEAATGRELIVSAIATIYRDGRKILTFMSDPRALAVIAHNTAPNDSDMLLILSDEVEVIAAGKPRRQVPIDMIIAENSIVLARLALTEKDFKKPGRPMLLKELIDQLSGNITNYHM